MHTDMKMCQTELCLHGVCLCVVECYLIIYFVDEFTKNLNIICCSTLISCSMSFEFSFVECDRLNARETHARTGLKMTRDDSNSNNNDGKIE